MRPLQSKPPSSVTCARGRPSRTTSAERLDAARSGARSPRRFNPSRRVGHRLTLPPFVKPPRRDEAHGRRKDQEASVDRDIRGRFESQRPLDQEGRVRRGQQPRDLPPSGGKPRDRIVKGREDPEDREVWPVGNLIFTLLGILSPLYYPEGSREIG